MKKVIKKWKKLSGRHIDFGRWLFLAFVGITFAACFSVNVAAAGVTVWQKAEEIMKDVYNQILAISTIAAVVTAAIALLMLDFSGAAPICLKVK